MLNALDLSDSNLNFRVLKRICDFIKTHRVYILYWCMIIVLSAFNLSVLYCGLFDDGVMSALTVTIAVVADSLLLFLPMCFVGRRYLWTVPIWFTIVAAVVYANVLYFRNFHDCIPGCAYFAGGFNSFVLESAYASVRSLDIVFALTATGAYAATWLLRSRYPQRSIPAVYSYLILTCVLLIGQFLSSVRRVWIYSKVEPIYAVSELYGCFEEQVSWKNYMLYFGFPGYALRAMVDNIGAHYEMTEADRAQMRHLFSDLSSRRHVAAQIDSTLSSNSSKNLILIVVESLNSKLFDMQESSVIAPQLCRLAADTTVIFIPEIEVQTGPGRSSDAQLIYNTGLLPLHSEAFVTRYAEADYPSLAKMLGRESVEVIGEDRGVWNHSKTTKSYGYGRLVDNLAPNNVPTLERDSMIFEAASKIIDELQEPFFIQITTIGMHQPYSSDGSSALRLSGKYDARDRAYLEAVNAFDRSLSRFLNALRHMRLYDNSIIVIIADHDVRYPALSPIFTDNKIPMLIINSGVTAHAVEHQRPMYQIDAFPTIIDVAGLGKQGSYRGMGRSLFDTADSTWPPIDSLQSISEKIIRSGEMPDV